MRARAVLLAAAALVLSSAGLAAAQPNVGVRIDEMEVRFRTDRVADFWINGTLDGGTARQLRLVADLNFDQRVGEGESQRIEDLLQRTLVDDSPDVARAQAALLLDDRTPTDTGRLALALMGLAGPRRSTEPANATLATTVTWPATNGSTNDSANETHVFRIPGDAVVANAMVTLEAPPGLEVNATQGLDRVTLSEDKRVARGQAQEGRDVEATFAPPPPPPPEEVEEDEPRETPLPGVAALVLVAAAAALLVARRERRR